MFYRSILYYAISTVLVPSVAWAFPSTGRTQILPKGRRALSYSELNLTVPGRYNSLGQYSTLAVQGTLNFTDLKSSSDQIEKLVASIDEISPGLSNKLELGSFQIDPVVSGKARIFGLGWGITDNLMFGVGIPLINATVEMKGGYTQSPALGQAAKDLREQARKQKSDEKRQELDILAQLLERAPKVTAGVLQDYFVNTMGYQPLGTWNGNDIGDTRLFMHYNYYENFWSRNGVRWGIDLPTGRGDDPDIINDFAFGTESYAPFLETIHDFPIFGPKLSMSVSASYKYFMPTQKTVRLTEDIPISDIKENVRIGRIKPIFEPMTKYAPTLNDLFPHCLALRSR